jgi:chromosome segregation ATPase
LAIFDELHQLEKQKSQLEEETNQTLSVPEEIEKLTQRVKATNSEIVEIETRTGGSLDRINKIREQLSNIEKQLSENKSDRAEKYRELQKKDKDMSSFIEKYEVSKDENDKETVKLEANIALYLENITKLLNREANAPSVDDFNKMQGDLKFKAAQMEASQSTATKLQDGNITSIIF